MSETTLPTLAFSNPLCPICLEETDSEAYGWSCHDCGIEWNEDGGKPERLYPTDGQCASTYTRTRGGLLGDPLVTETFRCMRMGNHEAATHEHPDLLQGWKNGDPGVTEVAE